MNLPPAEKKQLLIDWNVTTAPFPKDTCVHLLFEAQVAKSPNSEAVVFEEVILTYAELNARANQLAHALTALGVTADEPVGIALDRSPDAVIALLAILKAGGVYVPFDPDYPAARLTFMLEDSGARILITRETLRDRIPLKAEHTIYLDSDQGSIAAHSESNPSLPIAPESLAYIIYTSGSTGRPKGVAVEHRSIARHCQTIQACFELTSQDRVLQFASLSFDASLEQILPTLSIGAALVLPVSGLISDEMLNECMLKQGVTVLELPPAFFSLWSLSCKGSLFPLLRLIILAGDVVAPQLLNIRDCWLKPWPRLLNVYGPTEATISTTLYDIPEGLSGAYVSIGRPLPHRTVYVLDKEMQPTPIGVPGELHIGGACLARGYLNRPELTAEKFISDPFSSRPGARLYKTGDLVRYRPDGNLEFLGRLDHQVKIRGFRIELGEIEQALVTHPSVREALVVARPEENGDKRLVAYLVNAVSSAKQENALIAVDLRTFLKASLPDYMLPAAFVFLTAFPLTPNGKIDRKALPEPEFVPSANTIDAHDELEQILVGLWATLLHQDNLGIYDNFFSLGGHSLLAIQLASRLRNMFGISIPVRWIFEAPTIFELAERIRSLKESDELSLPVPVNRILPDTTLITPDLLPLITLSQIEIEQLVRAVDGGVGNIQDIYPLAPLQEGILFHHQFQSIGDTYLSYSLFSFDSYARCEDLFVALQTVIDRHDILRTAFVWEHLSEPVQVVWRHAALPVEILHFDPVSGLIADQLVEAFNPRHTRLDLTQAPLLRVGLAEDSDRWLVLILSHHLIIDQMTFEVILEEVAVLLQGKEEQLSKSIPFRNFVFQARSGITKEHHAAFFRDMLRDIETPTTPFGLIDIQGDGLNIKEAFRNLSPDLSERIRKEARHLSVTPAALFHLAWALVLSRCCGQAEVVFGTVLFGRLQGIDGTEKALGLFINTLPFCITCDARPLSDALRKTQQALFALMLHEHASLSLAQRCSSIPTSVTLFSSLLNYRHSSGYSSFERNLEGVKLLKTEDRTNYPFSLSVDDLGKGFSLTAQIDASVDSERICSFMQCALESLVSVLETAPHTPLTELSILPSAEKNQLLIDWNDTDVPIPETCVHNMFEAQVAENPDAAAVLFENQLLTYADLNAQSNQLAHALIGLGVKADSLVAIALERSPEMIIALIATLKAGGAYVPLDPDYPPDRLAFMLEDSGARILITKETLRERLSLPVLHTICIDTDLPSIFTLPDSNPDLPVALENLAYVIYTSGSTGKPKGVAVAHFGVSNLVKASILTFSLSSQSRVLQFASFSFDASVWETLMSLCSGAALFLPNKEQRLPGVLLLQYLEAVGITHALLSPTALSVFPQASLSKLKYLIVGGETCPPALASLWSKGRRFFNAYGPTEITVCATIAECDHNEIDVSKPLPIGRPIPNTRLYVLDSFNQPAPIGVPGELHIGGVGLARGYLNLPELTAAKFIPDPFSSELGERLYKTGDLVCYRADGDLDFWGRIDHQVKIRGFRIELGEIEGLLVTHPSVREALVVARPEENGDKRLVAYLVNAESSAKHENAIITGELRTILKASLPDYMLPSAFVFLIAFPLTPNGKIDRKALPEPDNRIEKTTTYVPPGDALEKQLVKLWEEILGVQHVGIHDNFFELGGHSLLAIQLASSLRDALGIGISVRLIFESPSVSELAECIRKLQRNEEPSLPVPVNRLFPDSTLITPDLLPLITLSQSEIEQIVQSVDGGVRNIQDIYPLAPLQEGIFFHHHLQSIGDAYLGSTLFSFDTFARCEAFISALQFVINRHDILRTAIVWKQLSEPVQVVWRHAVLPVEIRHFDPLEGSVAYQLVEAFHFRHTRLDLTKAPLLRIVLAEDGERWLMLLLSHHLIIDQTTNEAIFKEIVAHLHGKAERLEAQIPFRNFVFQARRGMALELHEAFFRDMLGDIDTPTTPFGLFDVQGDGSSLPEAHLNLLSEMAVRLRLACRRFSVTPVALCHLAWAIVLSRCCDQVEVVFGTVLFGRLQGGDGIEKALGLFINTLPFRITCDARPVGDALRKTQQSLLELIRHEHASLSLAQRCSSIPSSVPLFSSLLNFRHSSESANTAFQLEGVELLQTEGRTNYPCSLSVDDSGEGISLTAQVDSSVDPERICSFMQCAIESLVTALENAPQTPLCELGILPPAEKKQLLIDWNATTAPFPKDTCVHLLFEAQVAKSPNSEAVVFEEVILTYAELNARANQLAHALTALGVTADEPVGIALDRSPDAVIALLAILKAGGVYVPFDPDYPAARLTFMLEDSGARILITRETLRDRIPLKAEHTIYLDSDQGSIAAHSESNPSLPIAPESLAYIIYTSGSTGRPKGVAVEHRSIARHCQTIQACFELTSQDRVLQFASLSFDASLAQILPPLSAGAAIVLPLPGLNSPEILDACLRRQQVTVMHLTPAFFSLWSLSCRSNLPPSLRVINSGGDVLPPGSLKVRESWSSPGLRFVNTYGPTEATITATMYDIPEGLSGPYVSIGRPLPHRTVYVLDKEMQPTPIGVPGELHIGGACLARGYLNRPELTAEKFISDPFSSRPGARLYKTGDLVRYRPDGNLEFLGRLDHQVKIRGFRIELGEIEEVLRSHSNVTEAVVIRREDLPGLEQLVAYVVGKKAAEGMQKELRVFMLKSLPEYMIPSVFVFLDKIPLTPNRKIDRNALPHPESKVEENTSYEPPKDTIEKQLVEIWEEVLGVHPIGIHDNFFELGGHSLLAMKLLLQIQKKINGSIVLSDIYQALTIEGFAGKLRNEELLHNISPIVCIQPGSSNKEFPPLFFIHVLGHGLKYCRPVAKYLPSELPAYGLSIQLLDKQPQIANRVEDLARFYISEVKKIGSLNNLVE